MAEQWTVLGGWGISPEVLSPVFGENAQYIDINTFTSELLDGETLASDWQQRCYEKIHLKLPENGPRLLAGWSTGAMLALACADRLSPDAVVLISATPSFSRTTGFRFGTRPSVLSSMRTKLASEPLRVINDFRTQCGIPDTIEERIPWSSGTLADGLRVLEQLFLFDVATPSCPVFQIHGKDDRIIPYAAGTVLQKQLSSSFLTLDAPHACFIGNEAVLRKSIDDFLTMV